MVEWYGVALLVLSALAIVHLLICIRPGAAGQQGGLHDKH